jgi:hypothetical protein
MYFYGEVPAAEQPALARHLESCPECRSAIEQLREIRRALATRPVVDAPPDADWSGFMARLNLATGGARLIERHLPADIQRPRWQGSGLLATAALLALTTIGVVSTIRSRPAVSIARVETAPQVAAPAASAEDSGFAALSEEHFERSKLVVLGLAAKDPARTTSEDWTYERELAATLLGDTRMYRLAAEDRGLRSIADVMADLELVLLQTTFTASGDSSSLAQIQRLIQKRDLVEKMDIVAVAGL